MMKLLFLIVLWCILLVVCWPLAILLLIAIPLLYLLALPFRLAYLLIEALFSLLRALLLFPARLLAPPRRALARAT